MGVFGVKKRPEIEAAGKVELANVGKVRPSSWGVGISRLAPASMDFAPPYDLYSREAAMQVPTISRARDLLCSAVGALPLTLWSLTFDTKAAEPVEKRLPPPTWVYRPDPNRTRQFVLAWTVDDLLFNGRAYWHVTERYNTGYPSKFRWLPFNDVHIGTDGRVTYLAQQLNPDDLVEFLSPLDPLLSVGWRAINIANNLDNAAERFSTVELPAGWLEQTENSEPLTGEELADIASDFQAARMSRTVAALNPFLRWRESLMDPSRMQLAEAREHQALELARLCNVPAYLVGAPVSGMTYSNSVQQKADLIDFGAMPYLQCIEQTLSGPNVTPQGQFVRLETNVWLRNPLVPDNNASPNDAELALNPNDQPAGNPASRGPGRPRDFDGQNESSAP
jgi:hypothetical protein